MNNFIKRADRLESSIIAAIKNSSKIVNIVYSDGSRERLTEFDAIIKILYGYARGSEPHILNLFIEGDDAPDSFNHLSRALWVSMRKCEQEQDEPAGPEDETTAPGAYCFYDWYDRPVYAYWNGVYWKYDDKCYSTEEIMKILKPYGKANAFKPQE